MHFSYLSSSIFGRTLIFSILYFSYVCDHQIQNAILILYEICIFWNDVYFLSFQSINFGYNFNNNCWINFSFLLICQYQKNYDFYIFNLEKESYSFFNFLGLIDMIFKNYFQSFKFFKLSYYFLFLIQAINRSFQVNF